MRNLNSFYDDFGANGAEQFVLEFEKKITALLGSELNGTFHLLSPLHDFQYGELPDNTVSSKTDIVLEFSQFEEKCSLFGVDNMMPSMIPFPVVIFGRSNSYYHLNDFVTWESTARMVLSYEGITIDKCIPTGAEMNFYDVHGQRFHEEPVSNLKGFVICQPPTINLEMDYISPLRVGPVFEKGAPVEVALFGILDFASQYSYYIREVKFDRKDGNTRVSMTISPGGPSDIGATKNTAYVLGGIL